MSCKNCKLRNILINLQVSSQLGKSKELLEQCNQPYKYLIGGMHQQEDEISLLKQSLSQIQKELSAKEEENKHVCWVFLF